MIDPAMSSGTLNRKHTELVTSSFGLKAVSKSSAPSKAPQGSISLSIKKTHFVNRSPPSPVLHCLLSIHQKMKREG